MAYEQFHQFAEKLLKAPTFAIIRLLQRDIVQWLESDGESFAAVCFARIGVMRKAIIPKVLQAMLVVTVSNHTGDTLRVTPLAVLA